jgi:hypothetical protein
MDDCQGTIILDQRQVLKVWENYITDFYDGANRLENLEVEHEEEVGLDNKVSYFLRSEVENHQGDEE